MPHIASLVKIRYWQVSSFTPVSVRETLDEQLCFQLLIRYSADVLRLSIALCLSSVLASLVSYAQDPPRDETPLLEFCSKKIPQPCINQRPEVLRATEPRYSAEAQHLKISGIVVLWTIVGTDGLAHNIKVVRPLGHGLDEPAVEALKRWRFQPAKSAKKAVPAQINVEIAFHPS